MTMRTPPSKAADDQDEIGLAQVSKAPATRLKLHLDLAPEDVDREALSGISTYPEWDVRTASYLPAHARVLSSRAEASPATPPFRDDPRADRPHSRRPPPVRGLASQPRLDSWPPGRRRA